jgi:hypothetical protein
MRSRGNEHRFRINYVEVQQKTFNFYIDLQKKIKIVLY